MDKTSEMSELFKVEARTAWPEGDAGWLSQLTFSYLTPLLSRGNVVGHVLGPNDLYGLPAQESSARLTDRFRARDVSRERSPFESFKAKLWAVAADTMVPAGFCQGLTAAGQIIQPLLLRELVIAAGEPDPATARLRGLTAALGVAIEAVLRSLAQQRQLHLGLRTGQRLRAVVVNEIYSRVLRGHSEDGESEATNLVANDAQKVFEVTLQAHLLWASPLQVIVVSALLLNFVGPPGLAGIFTLIAVLPIARRVVGRMVVLRKDRMQLTDARVRLITEVLAGIRVTKLNSWENLWRQRMSDVRTAELKLTRHEVFLFGMTMLIMVTSPVLAVFATYSSHMLANSNNRLRAEDAFTILALIGCLRFPINQLGQLLGQAAQAWRAAQRISQFISDHEQSTVKAIGDNDTDDTDEAEGLVFQVVGGGFRFGGGKQISSKDQSTEQKSEEEFSLRIQELSIRFGEVIAVVGSVGSGKSLLVQGALGEAATIQGTQIRRCTRGVAFAAQTPFILNDTIKNNILFGRPYHQQHYKRAVKDAQLDVDFRALPARDATEIGERGVTLSGGQKARVALARAAYAVFDGAGFVLLDDPLSALDASTSRAVFDSLLSPVSGSLAPTGAAVLLVTHAIHFLSRVSRIIVLGDGGTVHFCGTWSELCAQRLTEGPESPLAALTAAQEGDDEDDSREPNSPSSPGRPSSDEIISGATPLMTVEEREEGVASTATWMRWLAAAGGAKFFAIQCLALTFDRVAYVCCEAFTALWTDAVDTDVRILGFRMPAQDETGSARTWCLGYAVLGVLSVFFCFCRTEWGLLGGVTAAASLYRDASEHILRAPMSYFDTTPLGRILNRFSYDTEQSDVNMSIKAMMFVISMGWMVAGTVVLMAISRGAMALVFIPTLLFVNKLQLFYRRSAVDLQRLDAVSRSPIQQVLAEGVDGASTIRAFQQTPAFLARLRKAVDHNTEALLCWTAAQRWIGLRLDFCGALICFASASIIALLRDQLSITPGEASITLLFACCDID